VINGSTVGNGEGAREFTQTVLKLAGSMPIPILWHKKSKR